MAKVELVCTIDDPDERGRRLSEVYWFLVELARKKKATQQESDPAPASDSASIAHGKISHHVKEQEEGLCHPLV